jgi:hypothetical protein
LVFFRLLFVANGFALREQGISRVDDAGVAADEAAYVEKRNSARKSAGIRSTSPASANGDSSGRRQHLVAAEGRPPRSWSHVLPTALTPAHVESAQTRKARSLSEPRRLDLPGKPDPAYAIK